MGFVVRHMIGECVVVVHHDDAGVEQRAEFTRDGIRCVYQRMDISPAVAADLFAARCRSQRTLDRDKVQEFAGLMRAGRWEPAGSCREAEERCITLGAPEPQSGRRPLVDGLHRLRAIVESGITTSMWVWVVARSVDTRLKR